MSLEWWHLPAWIAADENAVPRGERLEMHLLGLTHC